jgi:catechol-2,3-dioxygenase
MAIKACKIGHITLETPDVNRLVEHYTGIVGLVVSGKDKDRVVLSTAIGEEALVLAKGEARDCPIFRCKWIQAPIWRRP